jgi:hypothetical protein
VQATTEEAKSRSKWKQLGKLVLFASKVLFEFVELLNNLMSA